MSNRMVEISNSKRDYYRDASDILVVCRFQLHPNVDWVLLSVVVGANAS